MSKLLYQFYPIPKVVFDNQSLSPCAKLLFTFLASIEAYLIDTKHLVRGSFFKCYHKTLANSLGKSVDSVRKMYIPELITAELIEKRSEVCRKGDSHNTQCLFRIKWDNITNL